MSNSPLLAKTHRILRIIFFILLIIAIRVWHLSFVEREKKVEEAQKPQKRTVQIHANRGLIVDRYGEGLACNRLCYHAAIYYSHIRDLPQSKWICKDNGKKEKIFPRKEHIRALSQMLAKELSLDPLRVEDLIHSKASLFPHVPFIIKENISEKEFFRLRLLEKDWAGLHAEIGSIRFYPQNKIASSIIGYMGTISPIQYIKIAQELNTLQEFVDENEQLFDTPIPPPYSSLDQVKARLANLKSTSYNINDLVGKSGLEATFEQKLRGIHGKESYSVDINGHVLKKLPDTNQPIGGKTLRCSICLELQKFAEELLIKDESYRQGKSHYFESKTKKNIEQKQPWIKGGAIVAMDPNSGEVLALATYPRFDPNDFVTSKDIEQSKSKQEHIHNWFETPTYISQIWDGFIPLSREKMSQDSTSPIFEEKPLTLTSYLSSLFAENSPLFAAIESVRSLYHVCKIQETFDELLFLSHNPSPSLLIDVLFPNENSSLLIVPTASPEIKAKIEETLKTNTSSSSPLKKFLCRYLSPIADNRDKIFFIDLCRLFVNSAFFSDELLEKATQISLDDYWNFSRKILSIEKKLKTKGQAIFHDKLFSKWREENQKMFLGQMREMEKQKKTYQRPYLDYLDKEEKSQFKEFWQENRIILLTYFLSSSKDKELPFSLKLFEETFCNDLLLTFDEKELKLLSTFEDHLLYELLRTVRSFDNLDRPLYGKYPSLRHYFTKQTEADLASAFYPKQGFHFARSFCYQQSTPLGSIFKIVTGYAALKQLYEEREKNHLSFTNLNPLTLIDAIGFDRNKKNEKGSILAYGLDGTPYPSRYKGGRLIPSSHKNLGQLSLPEALERSSNPYFSILAGDYLKNPEDLCLAASDLGFGKKTLIDLPAEIPGALAKDLSENKTSLYSFAIGQHTLVATPLQAAVMLSSLANGGHVLKPKIVLEEEKKPQIQHQIFLPDPIRQKILEGLHLVINGKRGNARTQVIKKLYDTPKLREVYQKLSANLAGKTSTAEFMHQPYIYPSSIAEKYKDIWFGAISFKDPPGSSYSNPELVVVVYLHFGDAGKEAAPLASEIINKYHEILEEKSPALEEPFFEPAS